MDVNVTVPAPARKSRTVKPASAHTATSGQGARAAAAPYPLDAGPKGSRRKKTVERPESCQACGKDVALFIIRGPKLEVSNGVSIDVACASCAAPDLAAEPGRSDAEPSRQSFKCEICKEIVGCGVVQAKIDDGSAATLTVEVVCPPCKQQWNFCTECGGGGKYRTGKYRPVGLFPAKRRTCTLSHFRVGLAELEFQVYTGRDLPRDQVPAYSAIFKDAFLSLYAIPKTMREVPAFNNLTSLTSFIESAWNAALSDVLKVDRSDATLWYCSSGWTLQPVRKKGIKPSVATSEEEDAHHRAHIPFTTPAGPATHTRPATPSRCYVGICASQHDPPTRSLYVAELAVLQSVQAQGIARKLILRTLDRIRAVHLENPFFQQLDHQHHHQPHYHQPQPHQHDQHHHPIAPSSSQSPRRFAIHPSHVRDPRPVRLVWLLTRRVNVSMQRFAEKHGFHSKEAFVDAFPDERAAVETFVKPKYDMDHYLTFVARIQDFEGAA
ncbi:hypothetical protein HKX48_006103 [Thoreauomyces humboldtii]|nr:hypothetical protein HKX48_006103 [Thoreauomyces humboldtii]